MAKEGLPQRKSSGHTTEEEQWAHHRGRAVGTPQRKSSGHTTEEELLC